VNALLQENATLDAAFRAELGLAVQPVDANRFVAKADRIKERGSSGPAP